MIRIGIINLGINNIKSITNASKLFGETYLINKKTDFKTNTNVLILPGNGNFAEGMKIIISNNYDDLIKDFVKNNGKLIGICLGLQLFMDKSDEAKNVSGLSLIKGSVKKLDDKNIKIPLLGWYNVNFKNKIKPNNFFFNNGFVVKPNEEEIIYGKIFNKISAYIVKDNIYGFQFHPEKSGAQGLNLLGSVICN